MKKWKIRVPDRLALGAERAAADRGIPLNQFVVEALAAALSDSDGDRDPETIQRVMDEIEAARREIGY